MSAIGSQACPYLGRCEDAANYYFFPTVDNCCHSEKRPFTIDPSYQGQVCLGGEWTTCLRYKAATGTALDEEQVAVSPPAPAKRSLSQKSVIMGLGVGGILLVALILILLPRVEPQWLQLTASSVVASQGEMTSAAGLTPGPSSPTLMVGVTAQPTPTQSQPSPSPTLAPSLTWTPTATPSRTATRTATATATRTRRPTASPALTQTPAPSQTPARTPVPTATPTRLPTATSTPLPAPVLVAPPDGQAFSQEAEVVLSWQSPGGLPRGAYFVLSVSYSHLGATWYDEVPLTRATSWELSEHRYLLDLSDDGWFQWSVQVVRQTGVDADDKPVGLVLSPSSQVWTLRWTRTGGGGPITPPQRTPSPVPTPTPPPP
ncbi:MAG TPA: hypothetical protein VLC52_09475 [Anaerolineae bacterium]|nr:hypothetical protein [Anaerolineae bacterium]